MIVSFFGYSKYAEQEGHFEKMLSLLEEKIGDTPVMFYVGSHGNFDLFAIKCALEYRKRHSNATVIYVTPYLNCNNAEHLIKKCDGSIYPEIEKTPLRFAIIKRNEWVINRSDFLVFYYKHIGKTRNFFEYATRKHKDLINVADILIQ